MFAGYVLVMGVSMFWPAGQIGWLPGWIFLGVYVLVGIAATAYLWRTNPEVIVAQHVSWRQHRRRQSAGRFADRFVHGHDAGCGLGPWAVSLVECSALARRGRLRAAFDWHGRERVGVECEQVRRNRKCAFKRSAGRR